MRESLTQAKRWVVKIGSALLTTNGDGLDRQRIHAWAKQIAELKQQGLEIVVVSSGAVAEGMARLNMSVRPKHLHELQAAAAVGQMGLIEAYESSFTEHGLHAAQVLLTHDDLSNRKRYLNARSTIRTLLGLNAIPIINENDTVVTDEIRFGDNDTLAALVANLIEADHLIILTDQSGLYDKNPRKHDDAALIHEAKVDDSTLDAMVDGAASDISRGGMRTKLSAARLAARSGASTVIAAGDQPDILLNLRQGDVQGTLINASETRANAHKQWLAGHLQMRGTLVLDDGAVNVLQKQGSSLLAVGITAVQGNFMRGEVVACVDDQQREIARGLVNYSASEVQQVIGLASKEIESKLGYIDEEEIIHRDNLVLI